MCVQGVKSAALIRMKINPPSSKLLLSIVTIVIASLGLAAKADDDNEQGGDISGSESTQIDIVMVPTTAAPPGSSIKASLEADDENGAVDAKLKLKAQGLPAGDYSVSVTLKSDGSTVPLGTFTVSPTPTPAPTASPTATPTATPGATPGNDDDGENDGDDNDDDNDNDENYIFEDYFSPT